MSDDNSQLSTDLRDLRKELIETREQLADTRVAIAALPGQILTAVNHKIEEQVETCRREWRNHHQISMLRLLLYLSIAGLFGGAGFNAVAAIVKSIIGGQ